MRFETTIQPTSEPISTADAKKHLEIETSVTDHDDYVDFLVKAARTHVEQYMGIALLTQTVVQYWDEFPMADTKYNPFAGLRLLPGQVQSVNWLKYIDSDGVEQELTQGTNATGTYTFTGVPADTQTTTINSTTYTWQTTLTNVANNVLIGSTAAECARNLTKAINLGEGAGLWYAADTAINPDVTATYVSGVVTVTSKLKTTAPNSYATTDTADNAAWTNSTLAGGDGDGIEYRLDSISYQPKLIPEYNTSWPATRWEVNAVKAEYIRGWSASSNIPSDILLAMRLMIAKWFECREDSVFRMPTASQFYLDQWRMYAL